MPPRSAIEPAMLVLVLFVGVAGGPSSVHATPRLSPDVLTQRYDSQRSGRTTDTTITTQLVSGNSWGKVGELPVYGAVYSQPLYVHDQVIADNSIHDMIIVTTALNRVYAFDANTLQPLWPEVVLENPDSTDNYVSQDPNGDCAKMSPAIVSGPGIPTTYAIGIQSTPVIDAPGANGYVYVSYRTNDTLTDPTHAKQKVIKISLKTGTPGTPVDLTAALAPQTAQALRQRTSLLLSNRVLYLAFGSHCENLAVANVAGWQYRGTLLALDAQTLAKAGSFDTIAANSKYTGTNTLRYGAGIWQASTGIAADSAGSLYFITGNSLIAQTDTSTITSDTSPTYVANSFVRLSPTVVPSTGIVTSVTFGAGAADWFTPYRSEWHNRGDLDLGSSGVVLPPVISTPEVVGGGKEGLIYVLNRGNLGHYAAAHWTPTTVYNTGTFPNLHCITKATAEQQVLDTCDATCSVADSGTDAVIQKFSASGNIDCSTPNMGNWIAWPHIHGTPSFSAAADGMSYLYVWPEKDQIKAFRRTGGTPPYDSVPSTAAVTSPNWGMPSGMLSVVVGPSSSTVVFANVPLENVGTVNAGGLVAFDGTPTATKQLRTLWGDYSSDSAPYVYSKFVPPTIAVGRVFQATFSNRVIVYGAGTLPRTTTKANVAAAFHNTTRVTAVIAQTDGTLAVFGRDAATRGDWSTTALATLGSANMFPAGGAVALDTLGTNLAVFAIGTDGLLRMFTTPANSQATSWSAVQVIGSSSATLPPGAPLATVHRGSELAVFAIDMTKHLHVFTSQIPAPWPQQAIGTVTYPLLGSVAANIQASSQADVFAVDETGILRGYFSTLAPGAPFSGSFPLGSSLVPGAGLATGHRLSNELDVFAIGGNTVHARPSLDCTNDPNVTGCLMMWSVTGTSAWSAGTPIKRAGPLQFAPGVPGSPVTVAMQGSQIDVFFVSETGAVMTYFYKPANLAWQNVALWGPATNPAAGQATLRAIPGAPIFAVPTGTNSGDSSPRVDVIVPSMRLVSTSTGERGVFGATTISASSWSNPYRAY
jgi:hypothetical protein